MPVVRPLVRYGFAPAFFLGFIGAAVLLVSAGHSKWLLIPLLLGAIATMLLAERVLPYEASWNHDRDDTWRDTLHAIVNEGSAGVSVAAVPLLAGLSPGSGLWPDAWPLWAQLALAILVADVGITLAHYASHKWEPLWRLHAVHHSVTRMYGFNGLMKHPLHQTIETLAGTAPLLIVGLPMDLAALLGFSVAIQLLLQHANVDVRIGRLGHLWAIATRAPPSPSGVQDGGRRQFRSLHHPDGPPARHVRHRAAHPARRRDRRRRRARLPPRLPPPTGRTLSRLTLAWWLKA
ncbi:MAG: sterol desaturase family protein [Phenylobacterium sp.]|uniref:sterol desaturase family protein n=1 Tax=Phenylobacterium sp. TaxID=1871053 RepID=UPI001A2D2EC6|nr:sterol desaturase family protein [Phenylobacterium sp.]MBJ7411250.1 sterol desaturase family protein [Phenylobacterium sp.]